MYNNFELSDFSGNETEQQNQLNDVFLKNNQALFNAFKMDKSQDQRVLQVRLQNLSDEVYLK